MSGITKQQLAAKLGEAWDAGYGFRDRLGASPDDSTARHAFIEFAISGQSKNGCRKRLAAGQWFCSCGDADMGQTAPALCTECGGEYKLAE